MADTRGTVDEADLQKYDRLGDEWWNVAGPMRALHRFNPVRVGWIADLLVRELAPAEAAHGAPIGDAHADAARPAAQPRLAGFRVLDIGCGGGLLSESLAGLGATMVGLDPAPNNIAVARRHAEKGGLAIDYRCTTAEALAATPERFDAVLAMEVIEHVRDPAAFVAAAAALVRPGGLLIGATLNRTAKSYALAILGAEYVLGWVPRGTHDWRKFKTPAEFEALMAAAAVVPLARAGVSFDPLRGRWQLSRDLGCNYMVAGQRPAG